MDTMIRVIGCFVLTCILFACPVCLTLILALPWDGNRDNIKSFAAMVLVIVCIAEFGCVFWFFYKRSEYVDSNNNISIW